MFSAKMEFRLDGYVRIRYNKMTENVDTDLDQRHGDVLLVLKFFVLHEQFS